MSKSFDGDHYHVGTVLAIEANVFSRKAKKTSVRLALVLSHLELELSNLEALPFANFSASCKRCYDISRCRSNFLSNSLCHSHSLILFVSS